MTVAQFMAGVLDAELLPFVILDSTLVNAGRAAAMAGGALGRTVDGGAGFVLEKMLSNLAVLN